MGVVVRCDPREDQQEASLSLSLSLGLPVISLSIHPPLTRCTHHTLLDTQICMVVNIYTVYTNIRVYHPPDIVLSKRPKPSMVAVRCDGVCVLLSSPMHNWMECFKSLHGTQGRYSRYTPCQVESIFSRFFGCLFIFDFHLFVNSQQGTPQIFAPLVYFFM